MLVLQSLRRSPESPVPSPESTGLIGPWASQIGRCVERPFPRRPRGMHRVGQCRNSHAQVRSAGARQSALRHGRARHQVTRRALLASAKCSRASALIPREARYSAACTASADCGRRRCGIERGGAIGRDEFARTTLAALGSRGPRPRAVARPGAGEERAPREVAFLLELNQTEHVPPGVAAEALEQLTRADPNAHRCHISVAEAWCTGKRSRIAIEEESNHGVCVCECRQVEVCMVQGSREAGASAIWT